MLEEQVAECIVLSNIEHLTRHNRALMILAVTWAKEHKLIGANTVGYKKIKAMGAKKLTG